LDANTGRPVTYVQGGAVALDPIEQIAFLERGAYAAPRPVIRALEDRRTPDRSIVDVRVNAAPVSVSGLVSVGGASSLALGIAALVGIALGAGLAVYQGRQK
jgi:hypothetical protein